MSPHPIVQAVVATYLELVDDLAPGLLRGLYLVGSVALDDFRPHASDVDFVAVLDAPPSPSAVAALERVHARLRAARRRPHFDGAYVTWRDLSLNPLLVPRGPQSHEGRLGTAGRDPVTWHILARHGVVVRGPHPRDLDVRVDPEALRAWVRENLDAYWRPWLRRASRLPSKLGLATLGSWGPAWGVLGVARVHHTLRRGEIISKEGAGMYALEAFDATWRPVVEECLRIRRGGEGRSGYGSPLARRRDALAFMAMAIEDAET
jgi:hypothetical protein